MTSNYMKLYIHINILVNAPRRLVSGYTAHVKILVQLVLKHRSILLTRVQDFLSKGNSDCIENNFLKTCKIY